MPIVLAADGHHRSIMVGVAEALDAWGLGTFKPDGVFAVGERGIVLNTFPETPPELISVSFYGAEHSRTYGPRKLTGTRVQIRTRIAQGHPLNELDVFDILFDRIDRKHLVLSGIPATGEFLTATEPTLTAHYATEQFTNWRFTALT